MGATRYSIAAVERDTGLSKDVLRAWERRYGFPTPQRDPAGERLYPAEQVERLQLVKRLIDQGYRPGKLLGAPPGELIALCAQRRQASVAPGAGSTPETGALMALVSTHDGHGFTQAMQQRLARQGLERFIHDTVAPLTRAVGDAWEDGSIAVFEEHLFTELTKRLLRQATATVPGDQRGPRILLTSVPDELHELGLLMAEALFALEGARCIPLGPQMPLGEIARAAAAHRADSVALSFSAAFPPRQIPPLLRQLRAMLPASCELWVGGSGAARIEARPGLRVLRTLDAVPAAVADWRARHVPAP